MPQAKRKSLHLEKRIVRRVKKNSSEYLAAAASSEEFHGRAPSESVVIKSEVFEHDNLGDLGELVSLTIACERGGTEKLMDFEGARLAQSPKGYPYQLFIEGGDQAVDLEDFGIEQPHEVEVLGRLKEVIYFTEKDHLGKDGGVANYKHKLGELSGILPYVFYDVLNESLSIAGGNYKILPEGIDD